MTVHADSFWGQLDMLRRTDTLSIRETHWGFVLADRNADARQGQLAEGLLKLLGVFLLFAAPLPWIAGGTALDDLTTTVRLSLSLATLAVGIAVYVHASRGFLSELQVDGVRHELRLARRNARNISHVQRRLPFQQVESCFVKRSKANGGGATLFVRLKGRAQPLMLASGQERDLVPALERTIELVKSSQKNIRLF